MNEENENVSNDTKEILKALKKKKKELDKWKKRNLYFAYFLSIAFLGILYYFTNKATVSLGIDIFYNLLNMFIEPQNLFLVLFLVSITTLKTFLAKTVKEKKEKYEKLRAETIDRLKVTWLKDEKSEIRDSLSEEMHQLGINIRFKS